MTGPPRTYRRLMRGARRQIVALGGGGFSMEAGNPLLDDYVLVAHRRRAPAGLLPALGQRRRGPLHRALLPRVRRRAAASRRTSRCSAATTARRPPRAPARPGPDLRGGRQRAQPAGRVAGARHRRGAARGVGGGGGAVRRQRRLAVLVRGGRHGVPRPAASPTRARPPPCSNTVHYDAERGREDEYRAALQEGMRPATRPRTARRCTSWASGCCKAVASRPGARAFRMRCVRGRVIKSAAARVLPRRPRAPCRAARRLAGRRARAARCGRRRPWPPDEDPPGASSRWAAAASPARWPTRRSSELRRGAGARRARRASACCPRPAATPTTRSTASTAPSAAWAASCRTSRCSGSAPTRCRPARAPARPGRDLRGRRKPANLLAIWRVHELDTVLREAWERGIVLCGVSAGSMCWFEAGSHPLPRALAPGRRAWGCCPAATRCTTPPTPSGGPGTAAAVLDGLRRATPWRTAWACCSRARSWWRW